VRDKEAVDWGGTCKEKKIEREEEAKLIEAVIIIKIIV